MPPIQQKPFPLFGYNENMGTEALDNYLASLENEDNYRVEAVLKESTFERTERVVHVGPDGQETGPFVRKVIARESGMGGAYEQLFAAQQAGWNYPHLPVIKECYLHDDLQVVIMNYVDGETLQDLVYRKDPSPELAKEIFPAICDAVSELHDGFVPSIIHRDLKPSNIIVDDGFPVIIDLGIARTFKLEAQTDTKHFGTAAFAPPEQFGFGQTTVRSDVYSLGMLLYFCLTERIPAQGARESGFEDWQIPVPIRAVLAKATAFDPEDRYESAQQLKHAFLVACQSQPGSSFANNSSGTDGADVHAEGQLAEPSPNPSPQATQPVAQPLVQPVVQPAIKPVVQPTAQPAIQPMTQPTAQPVIQPILQPAAQQTQQQPIQINIAGPTMQQAKLVKQTPGPDDANVRTVIVKNGKRLSQSEKHFEQSTGRMLAGLAWNALLLYCWGFLLTIMFKSASSIPSYYPNVPEVVAYIGMAVLFLLLGAFLFCAADKSRIKTKIPAFQKLFWWHWIGIAILVYGAMALVALLLSSFGA